MDVKYGAMVFLWSEKGFPNTTDNKSRLLSIVENKLLINSLKGVNNRILNFDSSNIWTKSDHKKLL
jgi:hypothetical protein